MCGRFTLSTAKETLIEFFELEEPPEVHHERFNIAPTQPVVVLSDGSRKRFDFFRWGLIPSWAKDDMIGNRLINARSETIDEKPSFRAAFKNRRCLIIADGFYEWKKEGKNKIPMYIRLRSGDPFAFAGLWEVWHSPESEVIHSCTIITCEPNELMKEFHHRMPVILPRESYDEWLDDSKYNPDALKRLLRPYPSSEMEAYEVSKYVNSPANDSGKCVEPFNT